VARQDFLQPMPAAFAANATDTANVGAVNWRQYFVDPNLIQLIDTALQSNYDLRIALQRIQVAQSDVLLQEAALKPIVEGAAAAGLTKFGLYTMDGAGNAGTPIVDERNVPVHLPDYFIGLQSSWEIDVWGKLRNRKKAAFSRFLASVEGKNFVQTNLIAAVATNYYELLALDAALNVLDETITLQENALAIIRVQKEAGVANELAIKQFEAQLLNSRSLRVETLQSIVENENEINFLLGRYPQPIVRSTVGVMQAVPPQIRLGIPSHLLQNRPDIRQAELELIASKADLNAAKAAFYPSVNITGYAGFQAFRLDLLLTRPESFAYGLLGGLTAPLINRRAIQAEFNRADAYQLEALYNYQQTIINAYTEAYNQVANVNNLAQMYDLRTQEVNTLLQGIDIASELFRTGSANYLEVLFAQQNMLQSRLTLLDIKNRQFNAVIHLYKALGGGWQ
jgi:NodT family efflux transporter outer membrane factor (OMF) lipoprotein